MRVLFLGLVLLLLTGCAQKQFGPQYSMVTSESTDRVLQPPSRSNYDTNVYSNPELPYLQDLKAYRDYLDRKIAQLETRNGIKPEPRREEPAIQLPVAIEPKFRPRDPSNSELLLEDALEYTNEYRDFHQAYVKELKSQLPNRSGRSNL